LSLGLTQVRLGLPALLDILHADTLDGLEYSCSALTTLLGCSLNLALLVLTTPSLSPCQTLSLDLLAVQTAGLLVNESKELSIPADEPSPMSGVDAELRVEAGISLNHHVECISLETSMCNTLLSDTD